MQNNLVETLIGAVVVAVAVAFLFFAYSSTNAGRVEGYTVEAKFSSVDGISPGTDVHLHGIKIGSVSAMRLDPKSYLAVVDMSIRNDVRIPDDSSIKITSSGLLGSSFLSIDPGGSDTMLKPGGEITNTQGSIDLMSLIGRLIYGSADSKK